MGASEPITLSRACEVIEIPSGTRGTLPAGAVVRIMQSLAGSYTVATDRGYMYRVEAKDTDALGLSNAAMAQEPAVREGPFSDQMVWDQLKTVYDPEIPVNIVDLGLVYSCVIVPLEARREQRSYQDVHDRSRLRYGQRAQSRRGEQALAVAQCQGSSC